MLGFRNRVRVGVQQLDVSSNVTHITLHILRSDSTPVHLGSRKDYAAKGIRSDIDLGDGLDNQISTQVRGGMPAFA